jgi:hypothetical protein
MPDTVSVIGGKRVLHAAPDGEPIANDRDAVDLIADATWGHHVELVVVPVERFVDGFFSLRTRIAGEIVQKFVTYRMPLAILGDISGHLEGSSALRAFVHESNQGKDLWFVADLAELRDKLVG